MPAPHSIRRQVIEVTVPDRATAHRVIPLFSAVVRDRLAPQLERLLNAIAGPDEVIRIDRLELDLDRLSLSDLEEQIVECVTAALLAALRQASAASPGSAAARTPPDAARPEAASPLLLLSQFVRTGALPWWGDTRQRHVLDEAVAAASAVASAELSRLVRALAGDAVAIERLVLALSNPSLHLLLRAMLPAADMASRVLFGALGRAPALAGWAASRTRLLAWRALLRAASRGGPADLLEVMLSEVAVGAGTTLSLLTADLAFVMTEADALGRTGTSASVEPDGAAEASVRQAIIDLAARYPVPPATTAFVDLSPLFDRVRGLQPTLTGLLSRLRPLAERLSPAEETACAAALDALATGDITTNQLAALLRPFARDGLIRLDTLRTELTPLARAAAEAAVPAEAPPAPDAGEDSCLVETAGLCLLRPFLPCFFGRLELLDEVDAGFATPAAAHRATQLLHFLATGEDEAPDYTLILPKVLCGLTPHAPLLAFEPVTEVEAAEAETLLEAVIAHAACLGDISRIGLRGSFLLRKGILSTRDGAWLLRVERQPQDVLLERLPWTMEWARLPWMQAPMRVEW